jgi:hypothetical protein
MQHLFVEYPLALKLKEAGFEAECAAYYEKGVLFPVADLVANLTFNQLAVIEDYPGHTPTSIVFVKDFPIFHDDDIVMAPIFQQVFDWLEGMNIYITLELRDNWWIPTLNSRYHQKIIYMGTNDWGYATGVLLKDKKKAWDWAIEEALKLLKKEINEKGTN